MAVLQRNILKIAPGKWGEVMEWEKKFEAIQSRYGYPPSRYFRAAIGPHVTDTLVAEREWESFSAWDEAHAKCHADPERQELAEETRSVFLSVQVETYVTLE